MCTLSRVMIIGFSILTIPVVSKFSDDMSNCLHPVFLPYHVKVHSSSITKFSCSKLSLKKTMYSGEDYMTATCKKCLVNFQSLIFLTLL